MTLLAQSLLLLYGQHIVLNHLIGSLQVNIVHLGNLIDYPSTNDERINKKLHIHVYHGHDMFSKFDFKSGKYDNLTVAEKDEDKVKYYCLKKALDSKRNNARKLRQMIDYQISLNTLLDNNYFVQIKLKRKFLCFYQFF